MTDATTDALARALRTIHGDRVPLPNHPTPEEYAVVIVRWMPQAAEAADREAVAQERERIREPFVEALHGGAGGYMTREQAEAVADSILAEPTETDPYRVGVAMHNMLESMEQAAEAADREAADWGAVNYNERLANLWPSAAADPLDVEALAAALQALCDGPRRIQIVENDVEGMGSLVWPNEYADLLAAAYAAAKEAKG